MASTSGSSEMSLRKLNGLNFNFWKEQMQDYLIIKGQIDLIETKKPSRRIQTEPMEEAGKNHLHHDSDELVGVGVLHSAAVSDSFRTMEDIVRNL